MLLRQLAAVNSTPYLNSPHSRRHPSSGPSQLADSPTRSLTPPPQHTGQAQHPGCQRRETEEIRSGWELYAWCPLPRGAGRGQPHLLCPVRWLRYWTRPLASPLLSSSVLSCSPGYPSHNPCTTSAWEVIISPRRCPGDESWNKWLKQSSPCMQSFSAWVKNQRHTAFLSSLEGKVVMRKWTWIVWEPEGPLVPWTASPVLCWQPVSTAMHMSPYYGSTLRGLALTHGGSFP